MNKFFIIDFDSTFVSSEGLEVLAEIALKNHPGKQKLMDEIKVITRDGMEGKIEFVESLTKRLKLIQTKKEDISKAIKVLKKQISPSILRNKQFFRKYRKDIFIISGGFKEMVMPVVEPFGILEKNVLANEFTFDESGTVTGFNKKNLLAKKNGKVEAVKSLNLKGQIYVIGDGMTDFQIKELGIATKFIAFTENIEREIVSKKADLIAPSFDEFLYVNKLPMSISYPKSRIKVLLLENIDSSAEEFFKKESYSVERLKTALDEDELIEKIKNIHILGVRSKTKVTKKVLENAPKLLGVGCFSVGTDQVDLEAAAEKGIAVFNAPYQNTRSVVELVIGDIIILLRKILDKSNKLHQGIWDKSVEGTYEVRSKKLGIVGYGNIGSQLSVLAEALGMEVYFYDAVPKLSLGTARRCLSLDELIKKVDIISVHVDGNRRNSNLISAGEFKKMKDGVIFINLSRGFIVDIKALALNIKSGKVGGAAIDVFPNEPKTSFQDVSSLSSGNEPKKSGDKFSSELQGLSNVILTPHIGGNTIEAQGQIAEYVSLKLIDYINSGNSYLSVNLPSIQPQSLGSSHRLLHIHNNVPGILAKINGILAENGININGQYLKTNESVGYVITDVNENISSSNKKYDKTVLEELKQIPDTIRFRVLY